MPRGGRQGPLRPIQIIGDVGYVTLTRGHVATIDAADAEAVGKWNWSAHEARHRVCAMRRHDGKTVLLHRFILKPPPDRYVDHANGDALDNRRSNLRLATHAENIRNMRSRPGRELPKGVRRGRLGKSFVAEIGVNYQVIYLGTFRTLEEAAASRLAAEERYFGAFAPSRRS